MTKPTPQDYSTEDTKNQTLKILCRADLEILTMNNFVEWSEVLQEICTMAEAQWIITDEIPPKSVDTTYLDQCRAEVRVAIRK